MKIPLFGNVTAKHAITHAETIYQGFHRRTLLWVEWNNRNKTLVPHAQIGSVSLLEGVATSVANVLKWFSGWQMKGAHDTGCPRSCNPCFPSAAHGAPGDALIADSITKGERGTALGFCRTMVPSGFGPLIVFGIFAILLGAFHSYGHHTRCRGSDGDTAS